MAQKLIALNERDLAELRAMVAWYRRQPQHPLQPGLPLPLPPAPDLALARTPEGGIDAMTESTGSPPTFTPGYADCVAYHIDEGASTVLEQMDLEPRVYNLATDAVDGDQWVLIGRVRGGQWVLVGGFEGGAEDVRFQLTENLCRCGSAAAVVVTLDEDGYPSVVGEEITVWDGIGVTFPEEVLCEPPEVDEDTGTATGTGTADECSLDTGTGTPVWGPEVAAAGAMGYARYREGRWEVYALGKGCCPATPRSCTHDLPGILTIRYFKDGTVSPGTDAMEAALAESVITTGRTVVVYDSITLGETDFATDLAGDDPTTTLAIMCLQGGGSASMSTGTPAILAHIAAGGRAISSVGDPGDGVYAAEYQAAFTVNFGHHPNTLQSVDGRLVFADTAMSAAPDEYANETMGLNALGGACVLARFGGVGEGESGGGAGEAAIILSATGRTIFNGFLVDVFDDIDQGKAIYVEEILQLDAGT